MDRIERIRQSFITRKTERSDTHDQIIRHDPDFHKNKQSAHQDHFKDHDEDLTDISIKSLLAFLHGLLKEDNSQIKKTDSKPINPAISAYQKQGEKMPTQRYTYLDDDDQDYDLNIVRDLITALETIQARGYDHITLLSADGFLESIQKTVEKINALD